MTQESGAVLEVSSAVESPAPDETKTGPENKSSKKAESAEDLGKKPKSRAKKTSKKEDPKKTEAKKRTPKKANKETKKTEKKPKKNKELSAKTDLNSEAKENEPEALKRKEAGKAPEKKNPSAKKEAKKEAKSEKSSGTKKFSKDEADNSKKPQEAEKKTASKPQASSDNKSPQSADTKNNGRAKDSSGSQKKNLDPDTTKGNKENSQAQDKAEEDAIKTQDKRSARGNRRQPNTRKDNSRSQERRSNRQRQGRQRPRQRAENKQDNKEDQQDTQKNNSSQSQARDTAPKRSSRSRARKKMFVSVQPEEQVEVVITEEGQVQEFYVEMLQQAKTKGNIYKGTIHNLDANLQAAFINYGAKRNGFLQIDEIHPEYYNVPHNDKGRRYPPIQRVLKPGQEVLVQVVKEPTGTKGAFLTTYLSIPGRFLVLTPGREQIGISRKVDDDKERNRLRSLLEGLNPGKGLGVIVRTVSDGANKSTLRRDLQSLKRTWREVRKRGTSLNAPSMIYEEMDLTIRAVRDYLTDQISEIWMDNENTADEVEKMVRNLFPRKTNLTFIHNDPTVSLFERFNLQRQLEQIQSREVTLPSGGRLIIDPTEALTAIDINSGRISGKSNFEDMAFRTNMEAAKMIPLQLRLRDIGGQVVCDFIEMRDRGHWRELEKAVRDSMKGDRARYDVGKISPFGLLEIVRQRLGSSAISVSMEVCPHCKGAGVRRNIEWQSQQALKEISREMRLAKEQNNDLYIYEAEKPLAMHLLNSKRQRLFELEELHEITLEIKVED